jgi:hypothetical protein
VGEFPRHAADLLDSGHAGRERDLCEQAKRRVWNAIE